MALDLSKCWGSSLCRDQDDPKEEEKRPEGDDRKEERKERKAMELPAALWGALKLQDTARGASSCFKLKRQLLYSTPDVCKSIVKRCICSCCERIHSPPDAGVLGLVTAVWTSGQSQP